VHTSTIVLRLVIAKVTSATLDSRHDFWSASARRCGSNRGWVEGWAVCFWGL